ncbi:MAG: sulfatase-like hydrolase/transferase [Bacteroidales bacterium]|nr:sulfatase-like hydrolase/transferase [Bacteroidales bacterium]
MKKNILELVKTYVLFLCVFVLQKPLFMLFYHSIYTDFPAGDWWRVIWHGLVLDTSVAAYFTVVPGLLAIASAWTRADALRWFYRAYYILASLFIALVFTVDLALYDYWGFRLDATPVFYFLSSPQDAMASVSGWFIVLGLTGFLAYAALIYSLFDGVLLCRCIWNRMPVSRCPLLTSVVMLLLTATLIIPLRGGFTVVSMNMGHVYFSTDQRLNHAAINPVFSLMDSFSKQKNFDSQYRFMTAAEAARRMRGLIDPAVRDKKIVAPADTLWALSAAPRPDIFFIILESFSVHLMESFGGEPVAVNLDSIAKEGVLFTHFYANGTRTDKGLVAILSGYPAQPTTSLMKYPHKTQNLPSIARSLGRAGYETYYYYGGDVNFTNMQSYLRSSGFSDVVSDVKFPFIQQRQSKWGVLDHCVFGRLLDDLRAEAEAETEAQTPGRAPRFRVLQTSSSHEPFDVPYHRFDNPAVNAFAYTDSCVGDFIRQLRRLPQWEHTLVVLVPDHQAGYPSLSNLDVERYRIPLILTGGVVRAPRRVDIYGSQQDIAATLLSQLGLPHGEYTFSKDLMNPDAPHFAFFTSPDAFGFVTPSNSIIYNIQAAQVAVDEGAGRGANLLPGQAYLQSLYDDLAGL